MSLRAGQTVLDGKYHILELIGEGGMARVWLAEERRFGNRKVAIKEPRINELDQEERAELERRFRQEASLAPQLEQSAVPNVVRTYTLECLPDGSQLLVMEYLEGGSLADLIAAHPEGLPLEKAVSIAQDILQALDGFHRLPAAPVHRDVKPENILLDAQGRARLSDLGLTQLPGVIGRPELMGGSHPGTPLYMAPEQGRSTLPLTPAADLYALGCVLFEMLTGECYGRVRPRRKPSDLQPGVPRWLDEALAKSLADDPRSRSQTAHQMLSDLAATSTRPRVSDRHRDRRPGFLRKLVWIAGTLSLVSAVVAVGVGCQTVPDSPSRDSAEPAPEYDVLYDAGFSARVWRDDNGNGIQDPGETPLSGIEVELVSPSDGASMLTLTTDSGGEASIFLAGWRCDAADLRLIVPPGYEATTPALVQQQGCQRAEFGLRPMPNGASPSGWIYFTTFEVEGLIGPGFVRAVSPDGSSVIRLTTEESDDWLYEDAVSWSPDGQWAALESVRDDKHGIYKTTADWSESTLLLEGGVYDPSWSPDGTWIAFTRMSEPGETSYDILKMRPDGSEVTVLAESRELDEVARWSPDGEWIAFASRRDGNPEIYLMQADGSRQTRLTYNEGADWGPDWSPDGQWIAFRSERGDRKGIFKMRTDGSEVVQLTQGFDAEPAWSPDGQWIAFSSAQDDETATEIYVMRPDGSDVAQLTHDGMRDGDPSWKP